MKLASSARYTPFMNGKFEVKPGLSLLGKDFGNGEADKKVFQIDSEFKRYRREKLKSREEDYGAYCPSCGHDSGVEKEVNYFMARRVAEEYPDLFSFVDKGEEKVLECGLTKEVLHFDEGMRLKLDGEGLEYYTGFDAIACQVQEDLAIFRVGGEKNWMSRMHVCYPNYWEPSDKVGRNFGEVHAPVPGMEKIDSGGMVKAMVYGKPSVRFVWGVALDDELNHRPEVAKARDYSGSGGVYVRVERQTIWGFPDVGASLFLIRPYILDGEKIRDNNVERAALLSALESMSSEEREYKGVNDKVIGWFSGNIRSFCV